MGGTVSSGKNNDELVDNLKHALCIKEDSVEEAFRIVDRSYFFPSKFYSKSFMDMAWKFQNIHISAPCIYCEIIESLQILPHNSFLNIGSGTGYLSSIVGILIGPYGANHGIEVDASLISFAHANLVKLKCHALNFKCGKRLPKYQENPQLICDNNGLIKINKRSAIRYNHIFSCLPLHLLKRASRTDFNCNDHFYDENEHLNIAQERVMKSLCHFSEPYFIHANIVDLIIAIFMLNCDLYNNKNNTYYSTDSGNINMPILVRYDRIYIGASCSSVMADLFKRLLNVGGRLVIPMNDQLVLIRRLTIDSWDSQIIVPVCFAPLILPEYFKDFLTSNPLAAKSIIERCLERYDLMYNTTGDQNFAPYHPISFLPRCPPTLKLLCKCAIRNTLCNISNYYNHNENYTHSIKRFKTKLSTTSRQIQDHPKNFVTESIGESAKNLRNYSPMTQVSDSFVNIGTSLSNTTWCEENNTDRDYAKDNAISRNQITTLDNDYYDQRGEHFSDKNDKLSLEGESEDELMPNIFTHESVKQTTSMIKNTQNQGDPLLTLTQRQIGRYNCHLYEMIEALPLPQFLQQYLKLI